jgi:DNA-binding MarR family transcriptional regulator
MEEINLSELNFKLWLALAKAQHFASLARQRELNKYHIPFRQTHVLRTIQALGPRATLSEIAKEVDRKINVISKQAITMEKDGLITRIKDTPKSNLLRLELTEKGLDIIKISSSSECFNEIFAFLTPSERLQLESYLRQIALNSEKYQSD